MASAQVAPLSVVRTAVYVDGFNLYYWLKSTPFRWIDIEQLVLGALANKSFRHQLVSLKYFTAEVSDTASDPGKHRRQFIYLRAQSAVSPTFRAYYGEFRRQRKRMPQVTANGGVGPLVDVWATEEKGSDVNLAVQLVNDAWADTFDLAVVISNDSDLKSALQLVKQHGKRVGVLVRGDARVVSLRKASHFQVTLTTQHLSNALLPRAIPGTSIHIPAEWARKESAAQIR
jgi:uncharacterized LabA/DUF88 family protein